MRVPSRGSWPGVGGVQRRLSSAGFGRAIHYTGGGVFGPTTARAVFAYRWGPRFTEAAHPTLLAPFHPYRPGKTHLTPPRPGEEPAPGFEPGCDRCGALDSLGWAVRPDGRLARLCPTHLVAERQRAYARRMAEWGVRNDLRLFVSALPPHAYRYLPDIS